MEADAETIGEEGEIEDDSDGYTPLARPPNYSASIACGRFPPQVQPESEDELDVSSESDSDSDNQANRTKRPKLKPKRKTLQVQNPARKKYDIWSTKIQEDVLTETLISCDVGEVDRSRNVETYDYTMGTKYYAEINKANKRTHVDRKNVKLRLGKRNDPDKEDIKGTPRNILDLVVTIEDTDERIAEDIANKLCEEKEDLIRRLIAVSGKMKAIDLFKETKRIEEDGGMLIMNQTRRRTPGGVYFFLIKHDSDIPMSKLKEIFLEERQKYTQHVKEKKKKKTLQMKQKIAALKVNNDLPELLTRAELCVQKLADENNRTRKVSEHEDVTNPPPSPVTDGHESSRDGMEMINNGVIDTPNDVAANRSIQTYEDEYLDMGCGNDMDLF